jgi:hypothetical protein
VASVIGSVITEAANVAITIAVDQAELEAGTPVQLPKVQVGTVGGKPLYFEAVLSTT